MDPESPTRPIRRWDGGHALLYFVLAALVSLFIGFVLVGTAGFHISIILSEVLAFVAIPFVLRSFFDTGWRTWFRAAPRGGPFWFWCAVAVVSFAVAQSNLPVLLDRIWPMPQATFDFYRDNLAAETVLEFALLILVAAIVPGICEEIAFRGLIQTGLRRSFGTNQAIIWGGLMFAVLHLNPWTFVGLWSFGALLGYIRERTGSILPSVAMHTANNVIALMIFALQSPEDWETPPEFLPWYAVAPAGALLVYSVWRLHNLTRESASRATASRLSSPEPPS